MRKKRKTSQHRQQPRQANNQTLRIIAGQWRGRKLRFANVPGLRPTPDRVRETLFNWLQGKLVDRHCLDLFAGSGALAFEVLSRGAGHATLVEQNPAAIEYLESNIQLLKTDKTHLLAMDAFTFLDTQTQSFDIVFLDPPFGKNYLPAILSRITEKNILKPDGVIYLEYEQEELPEEALQHFSTVKQKQAGKVVSRLITSKF